MLLEEILPSLIAQTDVPIEQLEAAAQELSYNVQSEWLGIEADRMYDVGYSEEEVNRFKARFDPLKNLGYRHYLREALFAKAYEMKLVDDCEP